MEDFDELWNAYAAEFNDKLENANGGDWSGLDEFEQEIAALWKLAADVYADANSGLKKVGCNNVYKLFESAYNKVFARFENDDRIKSYEDIVRYLTEKDEEILEKTYEDFDEKLGPLLCERAYEFYHDKLDKRV